MNLFKKYRVKQVGNKFIPQRRVDFFFWRGIDKEDRTNWININYQIEYCGFDSFQEAVYLIYSVKKEKTIYF